MCIIIIKSNSAIKSMNLSLCKNISRYIGHHYGLTSFRLQKKEKAPYRANWIRLSILGKWNILALNWTSADSTVSFRRG